MPRVERGTVTVLLVDFLAAMRVMTAGLIYTKVDPVYLVILSGITFGLFFLVWALLVRSGRPVAK